jgi:hypothetical protein
MGCIWRELEAGQWASRVLPVGRTLAGAELGISGVAFYGLDRGALLLVRPGVWVRVNGLPVLGGLRRLSHKDEVLLTSTRYYFSLESTPTVGAFQAPAGSRAPICPICRGPIRDGALAVQCPGCGRWFHQSAAETDRPAKPCWTYASSCRFCNHPTPFAAEAAWRPDREESLV